MQCFLGPLGPKINCRIIGISVSFPPMKKFLDETLPWVRGFLWYMPSPFYSASVELFQLHGGIVSHMQALVKPSSTVHKLNTWILTTESISVLAAVLAAVM